MIVSGKAYHKAVKASFAKPLVSASSKPEKKETLLPVKPFVKWVGGKRSALGYLEKRLPIHYDKYYECFLGGGALFFSVQPKKAYLYDINSRLIITYQAIKKNVNQVIKELEKHKRNHSEKYFILARKQFNKEKNFIKLAGLFIYLNKTCFNGLYRVNKSGEFNVPIGKYKTVNILDRENLINVSKLLKNVKISSQSFKSIKKEKNAFYYLDPPYHNTFDQYDENKFNIYNHKNLRDFCKEIDRAGGYFMVSNSDTIEIRKIYKNFNIEVIKASKSISCKSTGRRKEKELIIRNYV